MSGHTPRPWSVGGESSNDGEAEVIVAADRTICWTADTFDDDEDCGVITDEDRANARLIAAAPEMLHACQAVANDLHRMLDGDDFCGMSDTELFTAFLTVLEPALDKAGGRVDANEQ